MKFFYVGLFILIVLSFDLYAQKTPQAGILENRDYPVMDGDISDWEGIPEHEIDVPWRQGTDDEHKVSFTSNATWKAVWDSASVYILVEVPDDDFYPASESGLTSWYSDKPEIYFDVITPMVDGKGPGGRRSSPGHYQFTAYAGETLSYDLFDFAYHFYGVEQAMASAYAVEFKIPMASISLDGYQWTSTLGSKPWEPALLETIGFDINIIDRDEEGKGETTETMQRINYNNPVTDLDDESWMNLDFSALLTFVKEDLTLDITDSIPEDVTDSVPEDIPEEVVIHRVELNKVINFGEFFEFNGVKYVSGSHTIESNDTIYSLDVAFNAAKDTVFIDTFTCTDQTISFEQISVDHSIGNGYKSDDFIWCCVDAKTSFYSGVGELTKINIRANPIIYTDLNRTIFSGESYEGLIESGNLYFKSEGGCDSTVRVHLSVIESIPERFFSPDTVYSVDTVRSIDTVYLSSVDTIRIYDTVYMVNSILMTVVTGDDLVTVREINGELTVKMYPNPANVYLNLNADKPIERVAIYQLDGSLVFEDEINETDTQIDLTELEVGIYLVKIYDLFGPVTKKLIIE